MSAEAAELVEPEEPAAAVLVELEVPEPEEPDAEEPEEPEADEPALVAVALPAGSVAETGFMEGAC